MIVLIATSSQAESQEKTEMEGIVAENAPINAQARYQGLYLLSLAHMERGEVAAAGRAAGRAYRVARTDSDALKAARVAAAAQFNSAQYFKAEWWLRRAANHATSAEDAAVLLREFQAIRARNPASVKFAFSVAPSDNINGGAAEAQFSLGDFDFVLAPSSLALSGIEYAAELDLRYAFSQTQAHRSELGLYLYGRTFSLSSASQSRAPGVSGSDYALGMVDVSLTHSRKIFEILGPTTLAAHTGRVWNGGSPVWDYNKLTLTQDFVLGQRASAAIRVSLEDQDGLIPGQPDATVFDLFGAYARQRDNGDTYRISFNTRQHKADLATNTFDEHRLSLTYDWAKPVMNTRFSAVLSAGRKTYDEFSLSLDGRRDTYFSAGVTAVFDSLSYFGFSPNWSVSATRTRSNVARFDSKELIGRIGLTSNF